MKTTAFFLSDGTGITVETLGNTLLSRFDTVAFKRIQRPYLLSIEDVDNVANEIRAASKESNLPILVFSSLVAAESRALLHQCNCLLFDLHDMFVSPMEKNLGVDSSSQVGRSHGMGTFNNYQYRIDALNYTMENDDGISTKNLGDADIIIVGVSRSGKTPTSLYLALNYGIRVANYPLIAEDLNYEKLPDTLINYKNKLYGLSINPTRLHHIRQERRSNSKYAELSQCQYETRSAEVLFKKHKIPFLDSSSMSIEEIATSILQITQIQRRMNR